MLDTGQHYACPQETAQGPDHCATLPVDAARLDRMVLQLLVTPDVLDLQTELLAEDAARESQRQQRVLEESQAAIACLADPDWVRASTLDPETYLHPDLLEGSRLFFHSFIDAVLIGPESAVIRYSIGGNSIGGNRISPTEFGPPAGSYVHEINLVHEHTVAEILVCPGDSPLRRNAEVCACGAERLVDLEGNPTDGWRIWKPMPDLT